MFSSATGAPRSLHLLCAIALLLVVPVRSSAQSAGSEAGTVRTASIGGAEDNATDLKLLVGRSTVVNVGQPITRVSLTRPEVADVVVTGTQQLLVHGKAPGTISMFVWSQAGAIKRYDVIVARDLSKLEEQLRTQFPSETITVANNGKDLVIAGTVSSKYVIDKAADVAAGYVEKKEDVVNLLQPQAGIATNQVMLRVRFAEVNRTALTELGTSLFTGAGGYRDWVARTTTEQFTAPNFDTMTRSSIQGVDHWGGGRDTVDATGGTTTFSDFLNLFLFNNRYNVGALVRVLQSKGLFQSLAEPNLVTENGKEASFLAGGEYPYPVVQGTTGALTVTIVFKEFGIRLNFTPTIMGGDLIHLKVKPEVSTLDFANAITWQGFRIPALSTRRADTEVELQDGQTFAIAGLMSNTVSSTMQKIPGIGDIPILGYLFKSKAAQKNQTELVVMITPQIIRRGQLGAAAGLPALQEPYLGPIKKPLPQPPATLPGSGGVPKQDDNAPAPVASATAAPAPAPARQATPAAPVPPPAVTVAPPAAIVTPAPRETPPVGDPPPRAAAVKAAPPAAVVAPPPAPAPAPASSVAPRAVTVSSGAPAHVTVAPATPPPPKVDEKKVAEERKAAQKAAERKADEDKKSREIAAKQQKQQQEAEGRALARQRELDAQRRQAEAKAAEEQRRADAKAAEEKRQVDARHADEQAKADRARLALAQKQAEETRKQEEKAAKERAKRDAELARQAADAKKKQDEAEKKRVKEIQAAEQRLSEAQSAYQAAVGKKKDGGQN